MRILMFVTDAHGGYGGISQYNRDVLEALNRSDCVSEIVVLPRGMANKDFSPPEKVRYDEQSALGLRNYLSRSSFVAISGGRFDLIYCAHINLLPVAAMAARLRRVPLVLAVYGIDAWTPHPSMLHRFVDKAPDLVISISHFTLDKFRSWSKTRAPTAIVPNAINLSAFSAGPRNPQLERRYGVSGRKVIMTFGRMSEGERYKGFDEVIELMPRLIRSHPEIIYMAAGDGTDRRRLEEKVRHLGVSDSVVFTGIVKESEKRDLYRLADAYVMPSYGEGFGFVVLEALACGIPVVASTADGTREAVRGGELGLLADPHNPSILESTILTALSRPKAIPEGLSYFSFNNFEQRLRAAISQVTPL